MLLFTLVECPDWLLCLVVIKLLVGSDKYVFTGQCFVELQVIAVIVLFFVFLYAELEKNCSHNCRFVKLSNAA